MAGRTTRPITIRLQFELVDAIEREAERARVTRNQLLTRLLEQVFASPPKGATK